MAKKQNNVERYAFIGLIVAGIALIVTVLLGLVDGLVALNFVPTLNIKLNLWISISAALIVLGLAAYAIMAPDKVARFYHGTTGALRFKCLDHVVGLPWDFRRHQRADFSESEGIDRHDRG